MPEGPAPASTPSSTPGATSTPVSGSASTAAEDAVAEAARLAQNAVDCLPEGGLEAKLERARTEGRGLRVKLGIDPTAPDIHLGHAVVLRKLREFQEAGHRVVLIIGDYTARVGDPSGRSTLRPVLSAEEIEAHAQTFQSQALRILDPDPERLEIRRNGEWLQMELNELLGLLRTTTVAQLLEREDFARRFGASEPISMLELLYPLLQGYDSVAVRADVELGGTDQKFNLLLGRDIQRAYGQEEQAVMTMPILVGTDGRMKMSKSLGNQIGITEEPREVYGKTMSIPDGAIEEYYRLLLHREPPAELGPRDAKRALAREIVAWLRSPEEAEEAEAHFDRVFVERGVPQEIPEASVAAGEDGRVHLPALIAQEFGLSRSEARRLIDQGGVALGEEELGAGEHDVELERADGQVLRVGRRRFRRLRAG
ncbi:MAG TPA: tyrosine--tRNA ligase [Solirubrobacteraceae bacterium]|jgi:tyrosyl-tRNA synthetase|nr:tyrosine--tRNA ligase [Solirubrobacteraceae bacterium]